MTRLSTAEFIHFFLLFLQILSVTWVDHFLVFDVFLVVEFIVFAKSVLTKMILEILFHVEPDIFVGCIAQNFIIHFPFGWPHSIHWKKNPP